MPRIAHRGNHLTWRQISANVIRDVIARAGTQDAEVLRREIRKAYPFGARQYWPYKAWLAEVKAQLEAHEHPPQLPLEELPLFGNK